MEPDMQSRKSRIPGHGNPGNGSEGLSVSAVMVPLARTRPLSFAYDLHVPPEMGISVPSGDGGCPDALKSAASRDIETGKGWRHAALWFPRIWDTETRGSPKSGVLGAMAPRNLGTRGSTVPPKPEAPLDLEQNARP